MIKNSTINTFGKFSVSRRRNQAAETAGADMLHIDIMDGHFVPNITIGPSIVEALRTITSLPLDVHLMIEKPDRIRRDFIKAEPII